MISCTFTWNDETVNLTRLTTADGVTRKWMNLARVDLVPAIRPSDRPPSVELLEQQPNVHLIEIGLTAWFDPNLSDWVFDVMGTVSFHDLDECGDLSMGAVDGEIERRSFPFSMQIMALPPVAAPPPRAFNRSTAGSAAVASCIVPVDVLCSDKKVRDLKLALFLNVSIPLNKWVDAPLYASRVLLMRASPIFCHMFSGPWAESAKVATKEPISFVAWEAPAVALAFIHIYSGWMPDHGALPADLPADIIEDFACDPALLNEDAWRHLLKPARFLGLWVLALAVNRKLVTLLAEQFVELSVMPIEPVDVQPQSRATERQSFAELTTEPASSPTDDASTDVPPPHPDDASSSLSPVTELPEEHAAQH
ncbi:hypothetical protein GGF32_000384 [Allomyces javanicus]|nr:hypothetical protein GGF32_000384 [Allomyces javanicus]